MVNSLEETVHKVKSLIENFSFSGVFFVLEEVDAVTIWVIVIKEELDSFSCFVLVVDEESLEWEEIKWSRWEYIKRILFFLLWGFLSFLFLCCSLRLWLGLFFRWSHWFDWLLAKFNVAISLCELRKSDDSFKPTSSIWHCLSKAWVQGNLEWNGKNTGNYDISNSDAVSY